MNLTLVTGKSAAVTLEAELSINFPSTTWVPIYRKLPVWIRVEEVLKSVVLS